MKRVLQPNLMRGHVAEGAALLLFVGLVMVLALAVFQGVGHLPS
jgi:hypothetical protein